MSANTASPKKFKGNDKMTRAIVANLNRQKQGNEGPKNGTTPTNVEITPTSSPASSPSTSKKASHKSLPPQPASTRPQSKDLPDVPEFFIVRPAPSISGAKIERNDRRVFINRTTMEKIDVHQGTVLLIQKHDCNRWAAAISEYRIAEEDEDSHYSDDDGEADQMTVGVAWPMNRIEPNGMSY